MKIFKPEEIIIGTAIKFEINDVKPFIVSLLQSGYKGNVTLFVDDLYSDTASYLRERGIDVRIFEPGTFPLNSQRFFLYKQFLTMEHGYKRVMLTDVRDVVFQSDPFQSFAIEPDNLYCFEEDKRMTLSTCSFNSKWITQAYGKDVLDKVGHNSIICAGVTIGSYEKICEYLECLCNELEKAPPLVGIDQAAHNVLIRTGILGATVYANDSGPVYTLGYVKEENVKTDREGFVVNSDGIPCILHQYDRRKSLAMQIRKRYSEKTDVMTSESRRLKLFFYKPARDFILDPQYCYLMIPLLLGTEIEYEYRVQIDPRDMHFYSPLDWRKDDKWKDYKADSSLFAIVQSPEEADFFIFPSRLDELIQNFGIQGTRDFIASLPYFQTYENKHVFMTNHDLSWPFHSNAIFFRASINRLSKDVNAFAIPYQTQDFAEFVHFTASLFKYQTSFVGYTGSSNIRGPLIESIRQETRLASYLNPIDEFFGGRNPEVNVKRRRMFIEILKDSWTVLCPKGGGENTFRFFEAMSMGRIPILIADRCLLPFEDVIEYDYFILRIPEADIADAGSIILDWFSKQTTDELLMKCKNSREIWEEYFKCSTWNNNFIKILHNLSSTIQQKAKFIESQERDIQDHITMGENDSIHLISGWYSLEYIPHPIRWTSRVSDFLIRITDQRQLFLEVFGTHTAEHPIEGIVELEGQTIGQFNLIKQGWIVFSFILPTKINKQVAKMRIVMKQTWVPAEIGLGQDARQLGVAVCRIWVA